MHARYFGDNVVFFGSTRFDSSGRPEVLTGIMECMAVSLTTDGQRLSRRAEVFRKYLRRPNDPRFIRTTKF